MHRASAAGRILASGALAGGEHARCFIWSGLLAGVGTREGLEVVLRIADEETEQLPGMAAELVSLGVQVIAAVSPSAVHAAYRATKTIPIIAVDLESDPVANGWAKSLGHPGGNVTGIFLDLPELSAKCLQMLRETVPKLAKLGVLWDPATGSVPLQALEKVTGSLSLEMAVQEVRRAGDFEGAFRAIGPADGTGLLMLPSPLFTSNLQAPRGSQPRASASLDYAVSGVRAHGWTSRLRP